MNSHHLLAATLTDILQVLNPTQADWSIRFQIINDLQSVVQTVDILRGATVEPFGSFVSNLFTRWGDLDISIELPNGSYISTAGKKQKQTLLLDVLKALKGFGGFHGIKYISHARVPILKCDSNNSNISCDISINNLSGQMKSKFLFWINAIDERFRDMVLIVKEWAKAHGINDSKTGTFNSYSLSLLIIFHFQTCEPAILPPLSEIYPGNMTADLYGVRVTAEKNIEKTCGVNINRIKSDRSRVINRSSLADLFISFLAKFCDIDTRALSQGISPHNGQWEDIATNMIWQPKTYALFIEDPFEQPTNCARAVGQRNLHKIAQAFQSSYQKLTSGNQIHPLAILVRPEVLSIITRSHHAGPSMNNQLGSHPQARTNPNGVLRSPPGPHLQTYHGTQYQNRNGGSHTHRGAHGHTQAQQRYTYQNSPNKRVNQRPLQVGQSTSQSQSQGQGEGEGQSQTQDEVVSNNEAHKRIPNKGQSSQNRRAQRWNRVKQDLRNE